MNQCVSRGNTAGTTSSIASSGLDFSTSEHSLMSVGLDGRAPSISTSSVLQVVLRSDLYEHHSVKRWKISRNHLKSSYSPLHKLVGDKTIKKRKKTDSRRPRLLRALNFVEQLRDILASDCQFVTRTNNLEESINKAMMTEIQNSRIFPNLLNSI